MDSTELKNEAIRHGARLCGIASIKAFINAPSGFGPADLYSQTQSVISFAKQLPKGSLKSTTLLPYSVMEELALLDTHKIAMELALYIEQAGFEAVIVPSEPYHDWDNDTKTGKGLVSLKHLAYYCGLGVWGKNHLLYHPEIGSMMKLGAILTNARLTPDCVLNKDICKASCKLCVTGCPANAITTDGVNQLRCRSFSQGLTSKGESVYGCNACRKNCPNVFGFN